MQFATLTTALRVILALFLAAAIVVVNVAPPGTLTVRYWTAVQRRNVHVIEGLNATAGDPAVAADSEPATSRPLENNAEGMGAPTPRIGSESSLPADSSENVTGSKNMAAEDTSDAEFVAKRRVCVCACAGALDFVKFTLGQDALSNAPVPLLQKGAH